MTTHPNVKINLGLNVLIIFILLLCSCRGVSSISKDSLLEYDKDSLVINNKISKKVWRGLHVSRI